MRHDSRRHAADPGLGRLRRRPGVVTAAALLVGVVLTLSPESGSGAAMPDPGRASWTGGPEVSRPTISDLLRFVPVEAEAVAWLDGRGLRQGLDAVGTATPRGIAAVDPGNLIPGGGVDRPEAVRECLLTVLPPRRHVAGRPADSIPDAALACSLEYDRERLLAAVGEPKGRQLDGAPLYALAREPTPETSTSPVDGAANDDIDEIRGYLRRGVLALPDDETLLAGAPRAVETALDVATGSRPVLSSGSPLYDLLHELPRDPPLAVVVAGPLIHRVLDAWTTRHPRLPLPLDPLARLRAVSLSGEAADGIDLVLVGLARSPDEARTSRDTLRGLLALTRMALGDRRPGLSAVLDRAVTVDLRDDRVRLQIELTADDVRTLRHHAEAPRATHD